MTNFTIGRWLLVALALVGLAFAVPAVSAHGDDTTADDAPPQDGTAEEWATWMEDHMTDHMGPGAVEWMESHTGLTVDEMAAGMPADGMPDDDAMRGSGPAPGYGPGHGYGGYGGHC